MNIHKSAVQLVIGMILMVTLLGVALQQPASAAALQPQAVNYYLEMDQINVSDYSGEDVSSAVAYASASEHSLVVWETEYGTEDHDIWARFVDHSVPGDASDKYSIAYGLTMETSPAVAYDSNHNRFLIVWVENYCVDFIPEVCADVIRGQLVTSYPDPNGIFLSDPFMIASDIRSGDYSYDYGEPALAFNPDDGIYAVVFTRASQDPANTDVNLYAQMIEADATLPVVLGPAEGMIVRNNANRMYSGPSISWSDGFSNTFLIASAVYNIDTVTEYVAIFYMLDTYQLVDPQFPGGWKIAPYNEGSDPLTGNCFSPSVAYDDDALAYVVVFTHEEPEKVGSFASSSPDIGAAYTIHGQRVRPAWDENDFTYDGELAFPIETDLDTLPGVSYNEAVITYAGLPGEMVVLTQVSYFQIAGYSYWLNHRSLNGTSVGPPLEVAAVGIGGWISQPRMICFRGACLAVWVDMASGAEALDIVAQHIRAECFTLDVTLDPACLGCDAGLIFAEYCYHGGYVGDAWLSAWGAGDYYFSYWSGDVWGSDFSLYITLDEDIEETAHFVIGKPMTVLFDEAHEEANTLDWERALELNPDHPDWIYYGQMELDLSNQITMTTNASDPLTLSLLQNYDVLVLAVPHNDFSAVEQQAIRDYITIGGGLLVLGDCGMVHPANDFLMDYGITFDEHCLFFPIPEHDGDFITTNFTAHEAVDDAPAFFTNWLQSVNVDGTLGVSAETLTLAWTNPDSWEDSDWSQDYSAGDREGMFPIAASADTDCGRVVAFADNAFQDDAYEIRLNTPMMRDLLSWVGDGQVCELEQVFQTYLPFVKH